MKHILLVDFSQIAYSVKFTASVQGSFSSDLWRYIILKMIKKYNTTHDCDEIILAMDGKHSWRKDVFSEYKGNRENKSGEDWTKFFEEYNSFKNELTDIFGYKAIQIDRIEGDDVIGVLCDYLNTPDNEITVISGDKDFKQLYNRIPTLNIYDPIKGEEVSREGIDEFMMEHLIKGDKSDGIPNIFSDNDAFITEGKRQKTVTKKMFAEIVEMGLSVFAEKSTDEIRKNIDRNKKCILLDSISIPKYIQDGIKDKYNTYSETIQDKDKIITYLIDKQMETLYGYVNEFLVGPAKKEQIKVDIKMNEEEHEFIKTKLNAEEIDLFN